MSTWTAIGLVAALAATAPHARGPEGAQRLERTTAIQESAERVWPDPAHANTDRAGAAEQGCLVPNGTRRLRRCVFGARRADVTVVLFGDSHAVQYQPALDWIAKRRRWRLVLFGKASCPPAAARVVNYPMGRVDPDCAPWRSDVIRRIADERPALVIAGGSAAYRVMRGHRRLERKASDRVLADGYVATLKRLTSAVPRVAVIRDAPRPPLYIPDCVSRSMEHLQRCAFPRSRGLSSRDVISEAVASVDGVTPIDATSQFCPGRLCPGVIGDVLVYRNSGHLTATYTRSMKRWLDRRLPRLR
jgi:hypothetical protein